MELELFDFVFGQCAPGTSGQITEGNRTFTGADEAQYVEAEGGGHAANLPFATFVQDHAYPRAAIAAFDDFDPGWGSGDGCFFAIGAVVVVVISGFVFDGRQFDAITPVAQIVCARGGVQQDAIFFLDLIAWVRQ